MKLSKLQLCLLLIACVMIISISTVSATENVNVTTFKEMNTQIQAGNNVILTKDITGLDGINDIEIKGKTTIDGNGHSIDAQRQGRFFYVKSTGELTLKNITLKNGCSNKEDGGAIYVNRGTLTVTGSTFTNNQGQSTGGAIANLLGVVTVTNSTFTNNNQVNPTRIGGGAISICLGVLTVIDSTFTNNRGIDGGAILNLGGILTVADSTFTNNKATNWAGAILNCGTLTVKNSTFKDNKPNDIYNKHKQSTNSATNMIDYNMHSILPWNESDGVSKVDNSISSSTFKQSNLNYKVTLGKVMGSSMYFNTDKSARDVEPTSHSMNFNTDKSVNGVVKITSPLIKGFNLNSLTSIIDVGKILMDVGNSFMEWLHSLDAKILSLF